MAVETAAATGILEADEGICNRLKARVPGPLVESFPDIPETYRLLHPAGALLVQYVGADYEEGAAVLRAGQLRELMFNINTVTRSLAGHQGAYVHLEAVRLALSGFRIPGFGRLQIRRERFVTRREGHWIYAMTVVLQTMAVELDEEEAGAYLRHAIATSDHGISEVPVE